MSFVQPLCFLSNSHAYQTILKLPCVGHVPLNFTEYETFLSHVMKYEKHSLSEINEILSDMVAEEGG